MTIKLQKGLAPSTRFLVLPTAALVVGALACGGPADDAGFGADARRLDAAELAQAKGGVAVSVIKPTASKLHYIDNPKLEATVNNHQGQSQSTVYLHHGTNKTGARTVATSAPGYAGLLQTRFKHLGGTDDLVVKYYDTTLGQMMVAATVPAQRMHGSVKLRRLIVHNITAGNTATNVSGSNIASLVDTQAHLRDLSVSADIDAILAQCPRRRRTQFQLNGSDDGVALHRIYASTDCAALEDHIFADAASDEESLDAVSRRCMDELLAAARAIDPNHDSHHVYIVKNLVGGLGGFNSVEAQGTVIREREFLQEPPWWRASLLLHEISHAAGNGDISSTDSRCTSTDPAQRNLMCAGSSIGKLLTTAQCDRFYNALDPLENLNQ